MCLLSIQFILSITQEIYYNLQQKGGSVDSLKHSSAFTETMALQQPSPFPKKDHLHYFFFDFLKKSLRKANWLLQVKIINKKQQKKKKVVIFEQHKPFCSLHSDCVRDRQLHQIFINIIHHSLVPHRR